jgi:hypothetical protein
MGTDETPQLEDFKWDDESTVIKQVEALAIYQNPHGDLVIRQRDSTGNDDALVIVPMQHAKDLVKAIKREIKAARDT